MKIIADKTVKPILEEINLPEADYVHIHTGISESKKHKPFAGLEKAEEIYEPGKKLVLFGFLTTNIMFEQKKFRELIAKEGVYHFRIPEMFQEGYLQTQLQLPAFRNEALEIFEQIKNIETMPNQLMHNFKYQPKIILEIAKNKFGYKGTSDEEELRTYLLSLQKENLGLGKKHLKGVFCDIQGTILDDGKVNDKSIERLIEYEKKMPVTIWTGGNLKQFRPKVLGAIDEWVQQKKAITQLHLRTPVVSKQAFEGYTVDVAIDDLKESDFFNIYKIKADTYIRV